MVSVKSLIGAGAVLMLSGAAHAADLGAPVPGMQYQAPAPVGASGWYLRGDVGVGLNSINNLSSSFAPGFVVGGDEFNSETLGDSAIADLGVGYQFNNWFRADVTGEYRTSAHYSAIESYTSFCGEPSACYDNYSGEIASAVGLANGYVDLGNWWGVTPYVGGGVGFDYSMFRGLTDIGVDTGGFGFASEHDSFNFAWALMAGLSFWVTPNVKLDLSYRYLDMGSPTSGAIICTNTPSCGDEVQKFHLTSNDFRLGLRYIFAEAPPPAPPLVTKY